MRLGKKNKLFLIEGNIAGMTLEHARGVLWDFMRRVKDFESLDFEAITEVERHALYMLLIKK